VIDTVCKAGVSIDNVIPIFIRGSMDDPRGRRIEGGGAAGSSIGTAESIPSRPSARRLEPSVSGGGPNLDHNNQFNLNSQFGGISFSTGAGFFPSLFGLQFQSFAPISNPSINNTADNRTDDEIQEAHLTRVLFLLCAGVILSLVCF
jgi:hypothetical protein